MGSDYSSLSCGTACCRPDNSVSGFRNTSPTLWKSQPASGSSNSICTGVSSDASPCVMRGRLESLSKALFLLHDLNGNGVLEEQELVTLNEYLAYLHHGDGVDAREVEQKYQKIFRARLNRDGRPVPFETFRTYLINLLNDIDGDLAAQEMILEQFIAEAELARTVCFLRCSRAHLNSAPDVAIKHKRHDAWAEEMTSELPEHLNSLICEPLCVPRIGAVRSHL
mmetsp:Transcript_25668/g.59326  ORF Transcript_25668/g.59326 Transcript_25668/m.59326 type:complete len:224 (-) Transcript_25668:65-736(-)